MHGRRQRGQKDSALALVLTPSCPPGKILMVTKCPLVTINTPRCDLLNVIYARQHRYLYIFCVSINTKKQTNFIARPKAKL